MAATKPLRSSYNFPNGLCSLSTINSKALRRLILSVEKLLKGVNLHQLALVMADSCTALPAAPIYCGSAYDRTLVVYEFLKNSRQTDWSRQMVHKEDIQKLRTSLWHIVKSLTLEAKMLYILMSFSLSLGRKSGLSTRVRIQSSFLRSPMCMYSTPTLLQ